MTGRTERATRSVGAFRNFRNQGRPSLSSFVISAILALGLVGVFMFLFENAYLKARLDPDVFKSSYEFLLVAILGGAVSLAYKQFSAERDRQRDAIKILREMHTELLLNYNEVKAVRRTLQALLRCTSRIAAPEGAAVDFRVYKAQMESLSAAQMRFEIYMKRAKEKVLYFAQGADLEEQCKIIDEYLHGIFDEYQLCEKCPEDGQLSIEITALPKLAEFIGPFMKGSEFDLRFKQPAWKVLGGLSRAALM